MQRTVNLRLVIKPASELGYNFFKVRSGRWLTQKTWPVQSCNNKCKNEREKENEREAQCYLVVKACFIIKTVKTQEQQTTIKPIVNPSHLKISNTVGKSITSFCAKDQIHSLFSASLFRRKLGEKLQQLMLRGVSYLSAIEPNFDTLQTEC